MKSKTKNRWAAFLILLAGCSLAALLAARGGEELDLDHHTQALVVETLCVHKANHRLQVPAWGIVEPVETVDIRPEVTGKVSAVAAEVFTGGVVNRGTLLFSIDAQAYENTLAEATAAFEQEKQALTIEQGRQTIAQSEWKLLEDMDWQGARNKPLALRQPQLKTCQAALQMALARQSQAALDVARTRVTAPCDGVILEKKIARGQVLDTGDVALRMACTECYHVLAFFPTVYGLDPEVNAAVVDIGAHRHKGVIKAVLPRIDPQTRQRQVLVAFSGQGVVMGAYASLTLSGPLFADCAVLPNAALRSDSQVWVLSETDTLDIRQVTVLGRDPECVVIGGGLAEGERVILSHIASPLKGMPLRDSLKKREC